MCRHVFRWGHQEWGRSKFSKRAARTNSRKTVLAFFVGGRKGRPFGFKEGHSAFLKCRKRHPVPFWINVARPLVTLACFPSSATNGGNIATIISTR